MLNDRFAQLLARKVSGEVTDLENQELQDFLNQNPEAQYFCEVFTDYWTLEPRKAEDDIQEEIHFQQILAIAEKENTEPAPAAWEEPEKIKIIKIFTWKKLAAAAAFIGVMVSAYFLIKTNEKVNVSGKVSVNKIETEKTVRTQMLLPDGTRVWLNSDSKLEYRANFNDSVREVTLEGEAYFDVVKDKKRPFIVHTSDIDIRVLGTAFNVKSYPKESSIETTLIHGMIEVTNKKEPTAPKVILRPHEKLVYKKPVDQPENLVDKIQQEAASQKPFLITALPRDIADSLVVETSWVYNKLVFDGETFRENAVKMERWYNVKIEFKDNKIANIPIHYKLENETVEEALKALQYIEPFTYKIKGNEIEILKK